MQDCRPTTTPAIKETLGADVNGKPGLQKNNGTTGQQQACYCTWLQILDQT